jgi:hypothetical protein
MTNPAGPEKDRVKIVPVLPEKSELRADNVNFGKGKECVQARANQNKGEHRDPHTQESPAEGKFGPLRIG